MRAGDRSEDEDEDVQPSSRSGGVLQEPDADVRRQGLGGDARADDNSNEQGGADELGSRPASERVLVHAVGTGDASSSPSRLRAAGTIR